MCRVAFRYVVLTAVTLVVTPWSPASAQTAAGPEVALEREVDPDIAPGDDFFAFANGSWLRATEIPPGRARWTARNAIDELTSRQVAAILGEAAGPPGSIGRKIADYRAAWLNEGAIEERGIAPLQPALDSIDQIGDKRALALMLGRSVGADVDPLNWGIYRSSHILGLAVEPGINAEPANVAFLLQAGLGLPDREHYVSTAPAMVALRRRYEGYIARLLSLAGINHADHRAAGILGLETALARTQFTREASANDRNANTRWGRSDFETQAPGMDWAAFLDAAGLSSEDSLGVWQPSAVTGLAALVASQSLGAWRDYLKFHLLHRHADVLPRIFADPALEIALASGRSASSLRVERAAQATQLALSDGVGQLYVQRYFPAEQKRRVEAIVANVLRAFQERVKRVPWMSPATRTVALAKLDKVYFGIGHPLEWQDYSDLVIDPTDAIGNLRRVNDRSYRRALARLRRPVNVKEWWIAPQRVAAVLVFQQNAYNFPAALLQAPKFDPAASDAANYGAIGAIVGHEVSHFVDLLGREWDANGRMARWWTEEDSVRFDSHASRLDQQFSAYEALPGLPVNGRLSQVENVADLAGLAAAFDAYRKTLGNRISDSGYVRSQDREFFLGYARSWRSRTSEQGLRTQVTGDNHAPDNFRIATVRNLDAWYDAFGVRPGHRLYLPPEARVRVW